MRKHSKWLWAIIIAATIASFVFWGSQTGGNGGRTGKADFGSIDGKKITQDEYVNTRREAVLHYFFNYGNEWPESDQRKLGYDVEVETYRRILLIRKLDEYKIHISDEAVAQIAQNILRSFGRGQKVSLDDFAKQVLAGHATIEDFERYLRHDLGLYQLISVIGLNGRLVTPQEIQSLYEREHQDISAQAVFFSGSNYLSSVAFTSNAVAQFYTNQMPYYRIPDRVQVSYVRFSMTNYLADADQELAKQTNLNARIEEVYRQRGTNYYSGLKPEEAKAKIHEEARHEIALLSARKIAADFATPVYDAKPQQPGNLEKFAKEKGFEVKVSSPFTREEGPPELEVTDAFFRAAFALTPDDPFAGPIKEQDAVYVLAFNKQIPWEYPPFENIRDKVTADYKYIQAVSLARQAGTNFAQTVASGLAQEKTFAAICADAKLKPVLLPPFSLSTREIPEIENHLSLFQLKQFAFATPVGKAGDFNLTREGGAIVYVQKRLPLDESKMKIELPGFVNSVRQARQQEAFNLWFQKEASRGLRDTPAARGQSKATGPRPTEE